MTARSPLLRTIDVVVIAILAAAVAATMYFTEEAAEERQSAAAALELQLAVSEVVYVDTLTSLGGEPRLAYLESSMDAMVGDHSLALHTLNAEEAARAETLIADVVRSGTLLLSSDELSAHQQHNYDELIELLRTATSRADEDAAMAERQAVIAVFVVLLALVLAGWVVAWSRYQSARARSKAVDQAREGRRLQTLLNDSPDSLFVIHRSGMITYRSEAGDTLLDRSMIRFDDIVGLAAPVDQPALESHLTVVDNESPKSKVFELTRRNGALGWFDVRVSDLSDDYLVDGYLVTVRDITTETRLRHELEHQAGTDALTGLPNRRLLQPRLESARQSMLATGKPMALLILDIDGFKAINDSLGHPVGDDLLVRVAARLNKAARAGETLIRMGGDEFAKVLPEVSGEAEALLAAERVLDVLADPFPIGDRDELVRTSVGVAITSDPDSVQSLINRADMALYEAKRMGGNAVVAYRSDLELTATRKALLTRALREADYDREFSIVYQPIVTAEGQQVVGLEALLRWNSPELGAIGPDEFIPLAEVTGEICAIGTWVADRVCRQVATWNRVGVNPGLTVSFNVSARQLAEPGFVAMVLEAAARWNVDPGRLVVEVTETAALDHTGQAQQRLNKLRSAGLAISIDDFGSGYSNLGQLISVPFDVIKIDRSLLLTLSDMREQAGGDVSDSCAIMSAIVSIAGILGSPVVCEGVETEQQLASLRLSGITYIQGFLTGRPAPAEEITPQLIDVTPSPLTHPAALSS